MNATLTAPQSPRATARELVSINPATLEELGRVPIFSTVEIQAALARSRAALSAWATLSFKERAGFILRAKALLIDRQDLISRLFSHVAGARDFEALRI